MLQPTLTSQVGGYYNRFPPVLSVQIGRHFTGILSVTGSMFSSGKHINDTLGSCTVGISENFQQYVLVNAVLWKSNLLVGWD